MRVFRFLMILLLLLVSPALRAQTAAELLNWTRTHLDRGNCDEARETYALYKEKVPQGNAEVERRIAECRGYSMQETKKYSIGDDAKDFIGEEGYKIAYLDASGRHGFAIKNTGYSKWPHFNSPTIDEYRMMYPYRYTLRLSGECWSDDRPSHWYYRYDYHNTFDFDTQQVQKRKDGSRSCESINIWRF